jgi:hypothetical protein
MGVTTGNIAGHATGPAHQTHSFNAHRFLPLGIYKGPGVSAHTSHQFAWSEQTHGPPSGSNHASCLRQRFQGISIPEGHCVSSKGSSGWNAVKWRKEGENWVAVSYGEHCTYLALFILSTKLFKAWALLLGHFVFYVISRVSDVPFFPGNSVVWFELHEETGVIMEKHGLKLNSTVNVHCSSSITNLVCVEKFGNINMWVDKLRYCAIHSVTSCNTDRTKSYIKSSF